MKAHLTFCFGIFLLVGTAYGQGTILWNESVNGPISNDPVNPTQMGQLPSNGNSILGSTESVPTGNSHAIYGDYFTFAVGDSFEISSLSFVGSRPVAVWIGNQAFGSEIGSYIHPTDGDLFSQMGINSLRAGNYGMFIKNDDFQEETSTANYRLDFFVTPVPEPSTISLAACGFAFLLFCRRKKPSVG